MTQITHPSEWFASPSMPINSKNGLEGKIRRAAQHLADSNGKPVLTYKQAFELVSETSITGEEVKAKFHLVEG